MPLNGYDMGILYLQGNLLNFSIEAQSDSIDPLWMIPKLMLPTLFLFTCKVLLLHSLYKKGNTCSISISTIPHSNANLAPNSFRIAKKPAENITKHIPA